MKQAFRRQLHSVFGRSLMAMATIAAFGFSVAAIQDHRGKAFYSAYVEAYADCARDATETGASARICHGVPSVTEPLAAHRKAYADGEPFLHVALCLAGFIILAPLVHRGWTRLGQRPESLNDDAASDTT